MPPDPTIQGPKLKPFVVHANAGAIRPWIGGEGPIAEETTDLPGVVEYFDGSSARSLGDSRRYANEGTSAYIVQESKSGVSS